MGSFSAAHRSIPLQCCVQLQKKAFSYAESIAFYGGEVREQQGADARLLVLVNYAKRKIAWMGGLSLWTNFYSYVTMLIPPLMTAPRYFAGEVEFGVITQVCHTFPS